MIPLQGGPASRRRKPLQQGCQPAPLLSGRELIAAGYRPGPQFKEMLHAVEDAQLEGAVTTPEEALRWVTERFGGAG